MSMWGYTACGRARVFEDGVLPEGWHAKPQVRLTADEVTARAHAEVVEGRSVAIADIPAELSATPDAITDIPAPKRRGRPPKVKPDGENAG